MSAIASKATNAESNRAHHESDDNGVGHHHWQQTSLRRRAGEYTDAVITARAEAMNREEFELFQETQVDELTRTFIERLRDVILTHNDNGEFLKHNLSPTCLTDDFVLRATDFVQGIPTKKEQQGDLQKPALEVELTAASASGGWLKLHLTPPGKSNEKKWLTLLMVSRSSIDDAAGCKEETNRFTVLENIAATINKLLEECFPECQILPFVNNWYNDVTCKNPVFKSGSEIAQALKRAKELQKNGMLKKRQKRATNVVILDGEKASAGFGEELEAEVVLPTAIPIAGGEDQGSVQTAIMLQGQKCWSGMKNCGDLSEKKSATSRSFVWKGILCVAVLYCSYYYGWSKMA